MHSRRNKRKRPSPAIHPRNKYAGGPPDFSLLASLYPSFEPFVSYSRDGRAKIDWTDFNATRELTRVLLLHDHGVNWWIPDGQLCPTVPNRCNYIHWIGDLLSSDIIPNTREGNGVVRGFDIGTGANCIYPLLGASLLGWSFVGSDVTEVALEWAEKNVNNNPHLANLIEIRKANSCGATSNGESFNEEVSTSLDSHSGVNKSYHGPPVLVGVIRDGEKFDFCMCNPPFFETMEEAGLNPKTACGGTPEEMVCPGGEETFIGQIIEDSAHLKHTFRWYTSMVGRKTNLKTLISKLRELGVSIVKTTEFVQGQTSRWGLAWSFVPPARKIVSSHVAQKNSLSFTLEGIQRQFGALHILQSVESFFVSAGASCKLNMSLFAIDINASFYDFETFLKNEQGKINESEPCKSGLLPNELSFRISIFQQIPGTLLIKASFQCKENPAGGIFLQICHRLEEVLKDRFCRGKHV